MATIRKRVQKNGKTAWQVRFDVRTAAGKRRQASITCNSEREAKAKRSEIELSRPSSSAPIKRLAESYLAYMEGLVAQGERERSYVAMLKGHIDNHILTDGAFATLRCSAAGTPECQQFFDRLSARIGAKSALKIRTTVAQMFKYGARHSYVSANPVRETEIARKRRPDAGRRAPFVLPAKADLKALLKGAATFDTTGRAAAVVRTLMYAGLRMSELRGLTREDVQLVGKNPHFSIARRADRYNVIGSVKSAAAVRDIDLGPDTAQALRLWLLRAPKPQPIRLSRSAAQRARAAGEKRRRNFEVIAPAPANAPQMVFPNENGGIWGYPSFRAWLWVPLMNHCGLVTKAPADKHIRNATPGNADLKAPRFGPHTLRHVYASLQIAGGIAPKQLQALMGHSSLKMTMDLYGHLWPADDADRARARAVEKMI
jgi:integrase